MGVDVKQIGAAFLTVSMFAMLGNMIKNDHFSGNPVVHEMKLSNASSAQLEAMQDATFTSKRLTKEKYPKELWGTSGAALNPCWTERIRKGTENQEGFVSFRLSNGPHYHISQVADAVVVAKYLGATLFLPEIRGSLGERNSKFEEIYDADKFISSLDGVVKVASQLPNDKIARTSIVVKVPHRVTEQYIVENIKPIFLMKGSVMLISFFPSMDMKIKEKTSTEIESVRCLGMFGTLEFNPQIQRVGDEMLRKLRDAGDGSARDFVAVDLRMDVLLKRGCQNIGGSPKSGTKRCFGAQDIGIFLRKVGFQRETAVYLTQSTWDEDLNSLKDIFPNLYTKETSMPPDDKVRFFNSGHTEFEKALDFYICSHSDVFVPAISGMFYANVVGQRIAAGRTQILVPTMKQNSASTLQVSDSISRYIIDQNHLAYSCFC